MTIKKWELLKSESLFESEYVKLYNNTYKRSDGKIIEDYYSVWRKSWVAIVAITEEGSVPLVYQYRNGIKDLEWALPAGHIEEGQSPLEAAQRELLEETGFTAESFEEIGSFFPSTSFSSEKGHFFLAKNAKKVQDQSLDEKEEIEVGLEKIDTLRNEIVSGKSRVVDSNLALALLLAWEKLNKNV